MIPRETSSEPQKLNGGGGGTHAEHGGEGAEPPVPTSPSGGSERKEEPRRGPTKLVATPFKAVCCPHCQTLFAIGAASARTAAKAAPGAEETPPMALLWGAGEAGASPDGVPDLGGEAANSSY